jgi:hypothetical protein
MHDRPTVHELLGALQRFLDEDVVPATDGRRQFLARVAANVARMVDRELEHEDAQLAAEWSRLCGILGDQPAPPGRAALRQAIVARTQDLCERIRRGDVDGDGPPRRAVVEHLRATVRDKLLVANPKWLGTAAGDASAGGGTPAA